MISTYCKRNRSANGRNRIFILFPFLAILLITSSCKKNRFDGNPATVQVFNAMDDGISFYTYLGNKRPALFKTSLEIRNKSYEQKNNLLYISSFPQQIDFYAKPDTMPHDQPALSMLAELKDGAMYSLFIHGEKSAPAFSLFQDIIPAINWQDSTSHIRIANFSESQAISVNIKGEAEGSLVQNLPYKSLSDFIERSAGKSVAGYEFEIRNQATGELLASYATSGLYPLDGTPNLWLGKSNTLVFTGKYGAAYPNQQTITLMNHR
ncbi:DUF4397 domain-containing protein [Pseudobacter ginsenosidimutans]|uniref:DUF4397 domain-containing protein n=1 Tax=Pseudobacter ginsenosidimutans TaxID=661488 RepID=A0A4Q7N1W0_9BACT|nr:DUF4397 domain-containing protein [Pseudobacter ginsenosidimutans]QEC43960.1 DUF4397 domain-containing protein [Pseudobacter ginsenosidimutans]RZS75393.1 hypothetical protein EV199_1258 [Pseudobacter ginsenosidimutans]